MYKPEAEKNQSAIKLYLFFKFPYQSDFIIKYFLNYSLTQTITEFSLLKTF
jgi:hypothetical protein